MPGGLYLLGGLIKNEIFHPWMNRNLSISRNGEVFAKFNEVNEKIGYPISKYEEFIIEQEV